LQIIVVVRSAIFERDYVIDMRTQAIDNHSAYSTGKGVAY